MSSLEFRQSTYQDLDLLDEMHTQCMREHVERHYLWDDTLFRANFNPAENTIVLKDGRLVGFFKLLEQSDQNYIGNIMVSPEFQNKGIGGQILDEIFKLGRPCNFRYLN